VAGVSISGAASGLDTASIINSLVSVQANQQTLLKTKQSTAQKSADAFSSLISSLRSLSTAAKKVADTGAWVGLSATSSSTSVTTRASGSTPGSLTFDVTGLAARHALVSADAVASTTAVVASGPLSLTKSDGTVATIEVGAGTLDEVVTAINAAKAGVAASAVQTAPGQYRLQVSATASGSTSAFTLDGLDGFTGTNILAQGTDATIHVGDALTGYDVTSASNTFAGVVPGLAFTVGKVESAVTISSAVDGSAVTADLQALVDAANAVLGSISTSSAVDSKTKAAGPLTGQSGVRSLAQSILSTVGSAGAAGVTLTREGRLAFDKQAFLDGFAADPAKVAAAFGASVTLAPAAGVTGRVGLVRAADTVQDGTYAVGISTAAAREQWRLDPAGGTLAGTTLTLARPGGGTFSYTAPADELLADSVTAGASVLLTAAGTGTGPGFTADIDGAVGTRLTSGADVAGTIDGPPASGSGNVLSLLTGTGGAVGLSLSVDVSDADVATSGGAIGSVTYTQGLAQRLAALVADTTGTTGSLTTAKSGHDSTVKDLQTQIDRWDLRLETYRTMLSRQFTAMETAIASLKSQTSFLSSMSTSALGSSSSSNG
jgi:flagellar hook-associated protein 2